MNENSSNSQFEVSAKFTDDDDHHSINNNLLKQIISVCNEMDMKHVKEEIVKVFKKTILDILLNIRFCKYNDNQISYVMFRLATNRKCYLKFSDKFGNVFDNSSRVNSFHLDAIQEIRVELRWKFYVHYIPSNLMSISNNPITLKSITDGSKLLVMFVCNDTTVKILKEKVAESLSTDSRILFLNKERFLDDSENVCVVGDLIFYAVVDRFDNNVIVKENILGRGSDGRVFKCRKRDNSKYFALKRIYLNRIDDNCLKQFHMELLASGSMVPHEKLIKYDAIFEKEKKGRNYFTIYLQMQLMDEGSLSSYLERNGPLNEADVIHYAKQILCGLQHLHESKFVHEDLKGQNILMDSNRNIKIADFGRSEMLKVTSSKVGQQQDMNRNGTVYFMAPEMLIHGAKTYGNKSDIWSVGAIIVEMLNGKHPYHGTWETQAQCFITRTKVLDYDSDKLSPSLNVLLKEMLNEDPSKRPSCKELLQMKIFSSSEILL